MVNIQQAALRAFIQYTFAFGSQTVQFTAYINHLFGKTGAKLQYIIQNAVISHGRHIKILFQHKIVEVHGLFEFFAQQPGFIKV